MSMKNSNDNLGSRTHVLPVCITMPQRTAPRVPRHMVADSKNFRPFNLQEVSRRNLRKEYNLRPVD
jgi:hypothetical protein